MARTARADIDHARLQESKWDEARATHRENRNPEELAATLASIERTGQPIESLAAEHNRLAHVSAADVAALLQSCAAHEVIAAAGERAPLLSMLASFGELTLLDTAEED